MLETACASRWAILAFELTAPGVGLYAFESRTRRPDPRAAAEAREGARPRGAGSGAGAVLRGPRAMLLFQKRFHDGLLRGEVTLTFRRWERPHVKVGGRYRCHPIGVLQVDRVDLVRVSEITEDDARRSGFESRAALLAYMRAGPGGALRATSRVYRIELHHGGDGDRVELALDDRLDPAAIEELRSRLARLDSRGAWTAETLARIAEQPRVAASKLAASLGRETLDFKADVRKLKKLGLTQSFEVGYEISPRGRAFLEAMPAGPAKKTKKKRTPAKRAGTGSPVESPPRAARRRSPL
jgi:hypothetical protein